ncbi:MAG: ATP-binding cassette domain-containing protein, partial [Ginsengibacter sp.]
ALDHLSFDQQHGEKVAIAGETGSGKSTLLKLIGGMLQADKGKMTFQGNRILGPDEQLIPGNPKIAYLSQYFELRNNYWVYELLYYANELSQNAANNIYDICRISHLIKRRTNQLSGGERQRIALARLLTTSPSLLLLDEPFSNLDNSHKMIMKSVIKDVEDNLDITCLMVSHEPLDILSWAEKIIVIEDGKLIQEGKPQDIYTKPVNLYCARLFGDYNLIMFDETSTFSTINNMSYRGRKLFIRPEQLKISTTTNNALKGIIQKITYWGSYYTLHMLTGAQSVKMKINKNIYAEGDVVYLDFSDGFIWTPDVEI